MFLCKIARPDIEPGISFLSTRVRDPDESDWNKLLRVLGFLKYSREDMLSLKAEGNALMWYMHPMQYMKT